MQLEPRHYGMLEPAMNTTSRLQRIAEWLCPEEVLLDADVHERQQALQAAAAAIGRKHGLDPAPVFRALWRREQVGSTALGQGVAIPHARIAGIERPLTLFMRPKQAIAFDAPDGKPVSNLLIIMVPADGATDDHLELLALVAQMFSDPLLRSRLSSATDEEEAQRTFREWADEVAIRPHGS